MLWLNRVLYAEPKQKLGVINVRMNSATITPLNVQLVEQLPVSETWDDT
ncbi:MAG: hypothetical protein BAJATHORv1_30215 [Candidatus Thorarchaeota archaeon]|nr:MAG: hypothetical protein BAJATHORv1_30215 [Candidatus Thorarchaeota archaeon]